MSDVDELSDAEIDNILERYDQTEPSLQRRIIAHFVSRTTQLEEAVSGLLFGAVAVLNLVESEGRDTGNGDAFSDLRDAIEDAQF